MRTTFGARAAFLLLFGPAILALHVDGQGRIEEDMLKIPSVLAQNNEGDEEKEVKPEPQQLSMFD